MALLPACAVACACCLNWSTDCWVWGPKRNRLLVVAGEPEGLFLHPANRRHRADPPSAVATEAVRVMLEKRLVNMDNPRG